LKYKEFSVKQKQSFSAFEINRNLLNKLR